MKMERGRYRDRRIVRAIERDGEAVEGESESHRETGGCTVFIDRQLVQQLAIPPAPFC